MGVSTFAIGLLPGLRDDRGARADPARGAAPDPGLRAGRRVGRRGPDRLRARRPGPPRLLGELAAGRRAGRPAAGERPAVRARGDRRAEEAFVAWGWRIPFLLSARAGADRALRSGWPSRSRRCSRRRRRTPRSRRPPASRRRMPILEVFRRYPREVLTAMGARFAENVSYYIFTIVITTYATKRLGLPSSTVLGAVLIGAAVHLITIPIWGALSDRFGRRPLYLLGAAGVGIWAFAFIALVEHPQLPDAGPRGRRRPAVPRRDVRAAGGVPVRAVRHEGALLRGVDRLPARVDPRRRPRTAASPCGSTRRSTRATP